MLRLFRSHIRPVCQRLGFDLVRSAKKGGFYRTLPRDFDALHTEIFRQVEPFTMTSPERVYSLIEAVKYVVGNGIDGDFVECGVWKGGSSMVMVLTLLKLGVRDRPIYLYDTFQGMNAPTDEDVAVNGVQARTKFERKKVTDDTSDWFVAGLDEVKRNIAETGYPQNNLHFVEGQVEETLQHTVPEKVALLRLDTDWYESTKQEMECLFPRLESGGVLIVDDYGYWQGARKAVDAYLHAHELNPLLARIDDSGRQLIKR